MNDLTERVRTGFESAFGHAPDGIWSAPGRVNLIGEHTDYNHGFALPFAIDRRTSVALSLRSDPKITVSSSIADEIIHTSLDALDPQNENGWASYVLGVAWALGKVGASLDAVPGFDLHIDSDVPLGAGLSSSAALECAVASALNDAWHVGFDRHKLVTVGNLAENEFVGSPTGILDQSASLLAQADNALFIDFQSLESSAVPLGFVDAGLVILVIDSTIEHTHVDGGYAARRASCEAGARALGVSSLREISIDDLPTVREKLDDETFRRVRHIVTDNERTLETVKLLRQHRPEAIGDLLDAAHRSLRDDFEVSVPELDLAVEISQNYGALGARMVGGGFGGSAIALVPEHMITQVQVAIDSAFAEHGYAQPEMFVVTATDGAHREA